MPFGLFNHPFVFAAVAIAAIGVVIYELIEENKRRQPLSSRRPPPNNPPGPPPDNRPRPPPDNRPRPPPNNPRRPPPDNPNPPRSPPNDSQKSPPGNNLRKRNINRTASKENAQEIFIESDNQKDSVSAVRVISKPSASNQNSHDKKFDENNYCKNMLDKLTSDTKNITENIKCEKISGHNIYEEESDSSENNLLPKCEEKVINQAATDKNIGNHKKPYKRKRKTKSNVEKTTKTHTDKKHDIGLESSDHYENESSSESQSSDSSTFSPVKVTKESPVQQKHASNNAPEQGSGSSLSSDEDTYKKNVLKAFKNDLQNCEVIYSTDNSGTCSSKDVEEVDSPDSKLCKGCRENHINTRAYPCNHAYLCVDCALRVFRLFKKCSVCLQDVKEFVQIAL